ncbi:MAG: DUF4097 domain-containing protein [Acidobacteria bacterium]|nr:DUF4097 domain-containing protein [Acidobacteriota bacterium]
MKKTTLFCLIFLFLLATVQAAESRETLTLDASGCRAMRIDCGAGYLKVQGKEGLQRIEVTAMLRVKGIGMGELAEFRKENVILKLEKTGSEAVLLAKIDEKFFLDKLFGGREARIDLDVSLPRSMNLSVEDGSGNVTINSLGGSLDLNDGSGDAMLDEIAGPVKIVDGSGDLRLANVKGAVEIEDGSGGLDLSDIAGHVEIEDGSGDIELKNAGGDVVVDDGSGEIDLRGVRGSVRIDDGSGNIVIDGVEKDVTIEDAGSGEVDIRNVRGRVRK